MKLSTNYLLTNQLQTRFDFKQPSRIDMSLNQIIKPSGLNECQPFSKYYGDIFG